MTIYAPNPQPFTCAICLKPWAADQWSFTYGPDLPIPPLCHRCNMTWGRSVGGQGDRNRDRRIIRQIFALAEAITVEAHRAEHKKGHHYGRA